ncbi:MAG: GTPase, partial [Gemmatimonas sp.]
MNLPVVAIVGRPNVGKSQLFNRIVGDDAAIVSDEAGTTRDRHFAQAEWSGRHFYVVDTGGLTEDSNAPIDVEIRHQVEQAVAEADLMMLVVDAKNGLHPSDRRIVDMLRQAQKPWVLVANKVDNPASADFYEFYELGAGDPIPVSAQNGKGSGDMLDVIIEHIPDAPEHAPDEVRVAVIGRPNVGKS